MENNIIKVDKDELMYLLIRFGKDMTSDDIELIEESILKAIFHRKEFAEIDIQLVKTLMSWASNFSVIDEYSTLDRQLKNYYDDKLKILSESNIINN
jgi:hypothetical protein